MMRGPKRDHRNPRGPDVLQVTPQWQPDWKLECATPIRCDPPPLLRLIVCLCHWRALFNFDGLSADKRGISACDYRDPLGCFYMCVYGNSSADLGL